MTSHELRHVIEHGGRSLDALRQQLIQGFPHGVIFCLTTIPNKEGGIGGGGVTETTKRLAKRRKIKYSQVISGGNMTREKSVAFAKEDAPSLYKRQGGAPTQKILEHFNKHYPDRTNFDLQIDHKIAELALYRLAEQKARGVKVPVAIVEGKAVALLLEHMMKEMTDAIPAIVYIGVFANEGISVERKQQDQAKKMRKAGAPEKNIPKKKEVRTDRRSTHTRLINHLTTTYSELIKPEDVSYMNMRRNVNYFWNSSYVTPDQLIDLGLEMMDRDMKGFAKTLNSQNHTNHNHNATRHAKRRKHNKSFEKSIGHVPNTVIPFWS